MVKETRTWYCDACGCEIEGYKCYLEFIEFDSDGYLQSRGYDFCKPCTISFVEWKESRKAEATVDA